MEHTVASECRAVFLSYARRDGYDFVSKLSRDLREAGYKPWVDTNQIQPGERWAEEIETAIDECDVLIAILTRAYPDSEICRAEHMRALRKGKVVIPLLLEEGADRPLPLEHINYKDFTDAGRYPQSLSELMAAFGASPSSLPQKFCSTFVNAPPLPPAYVTRSKELEALRIAVIGNGSRHVALTALQGMGGVGKSVLAVALCNDSLIQEAFPDGVIWVSIGRTPGNLVSQMRSIGSIFRDRPENYETTETGAARLRQILRGKAVLLVLDDVWERLHIEPFLTGEMRSRVLFTSRDRSIALDLAATEVRLGTMTKEQAVGVLTEWAGSSDSAFLEIAQCTGYLPLALKLAGAQLREGMKAADWIKLYKSSPLQATAAYRVRSEKDDLTTCFDLSLARYEAMQQKLYYALGIFPEDLRIPFAVVERLWRTLDPAMAENRCRELVADFARMELLDTDAQNCIGLHDLMQEYALLKLNGDEHATHQKFLDSYVDRQRQWWKAKNDGYFFRFAAHHFVSGGQVEQLQKLLFDYRWLRAKLLSTEPAAVIEDFNSVPASADRDLVQSAIRLSAHVLIRDQQQLAGQLAGRLLGYPSAAIARLLAGAVAHTSHAWLRPLHRSLRGGNSALLRTLSGHGGAVSSVIFTPDEKIAVSGSYDGTIKLWDWQRGIEIRTLMGHGRQVNCLAITQNGRFLISGSSDFRVKIWDVESGTVTRTIAVSDCPVVHVAAEGDSKFVSTDVEGRQEAWNLHNGESAGKGFDEVGFDKVVNDAFERVSCRSRDRELKATESGGLEVWDHCSNSLLRTLIGHPSYIHALAITGDGKYGISAHDDGTLRVWDLEIAEPLIEARPKQRALLLALLPLGRSVASTCADRRLRIWTPESSQPVRQLLKSTPEPLISLRSSLSGLSLVAVTWTLRLRIIERLLGLPILDPRSILTHWLVRLKRDKLPAGRCVSVAATSPGLAKIVFSHSDPFWSRLNLWTTSIKSSNGRHRGKITALAVSADGRFVASGSEDGTVKLWNSRTRNELLNLDAHDGGVSGVAISGGGRRIVSTGFADRCVKMWDTRTGQEMARFTADCAVQACCISLFGRLVIASDISGQLHSLRLKRGALKS